MPDILTARRFASLQRTLRKLQMDINSQVIKENTHGLIVSTMCLVAGGTERDKERKEGWGRGAWPKQA